MFLLSAISWLESVENDALRQWLVFPGWVETGIPGSNYGKRSETRESTRHGTSFHSADDKVKLTLDLQFLPGHTHRTPCFEYLNESM